MYVGTKATSREVIVENWNGVWLTRTVRVKTAKERWERSNQDVPVAVPWRKNEGDEKMDGERPEGEVVLMDKDNKEKLENTVRCRKGCTYRARTWKRWGLRRHVPDACQYSWEQRGQRTREIVDGEWKGS